MVQVLITTYGTLHGPAPAGDALQVDLTRALHNPHANPEIGRAHV